ncbi:hypothetical protein ACFW1F_04010 [Streptomyces bungoensis]|uniref:hypothetical protein n=1 Tax=Streptomyces bungoensis TaxID=285568 RepID=UPI003448C66D
MLYYLAPLSAALAVVAATTCVLLRRDRRMARTCLDRDRPGPSVRAPRQVTATPGSAARSR